MSEIEESTKFKTADHIYIFCYIIYRFCYILNIQYSNVYDNKNAPSGNQRKEEVVKRKDEIDAFYMH